jgi:hypothetical protein
VTADRDARPSADPRRRVLTPAAFGAVLGCVIVVVACLVAGLSLLLLTPFGVLLALSSLVAICVTFGVAKFWRQPLSPRVIMVVSVCLTILLFAAFPLYFIILNGGGHTGPMFG